jgi:hypothetical protein
MTALTTQRPTLSVLRIFLSTQFENVRLGQKRTFAPQKLVRFTPKADIHQCEEQCEESIGSGQEVHGPSPAKALP